MLTSHFKKLSSWTSRNFLDLVLIAVILGVGVFVAFRNYIPGTWLLGWDSLTPELNFKLNIVRSLSAVWQEYQGLGLLGGMGHAADLPRQLILLASSMFLPQSFLRYFWTFLMLCLGPLGVYFMLSRGVIDKTVGGLSKFAGFASAIFYLFNLATLQIFYTPFETFVSFYGFFPWLLYFAIDFLKNGGKKKLLIYFLISLLATGAFYVQTLFVVYAVFLSVFAIETIVKLGKTGVVRSIKLALVTFFVNAFWLLPALYFSLTSAAIPVNSHINSIATPETQAMNLARVGLTNIASLKGYWFDYYDWGQNGTYDFLYKTWLKFSNQPHVVAISLTLFAFAVLGILTSLLKKKTSYGISFLVIFGVSYFMLNGGSVHVIPFFSEIFRNAFTKWANAMALIYAVGIGLLIYAVSDTLKNKFKYFLAALLSILVIGGSVSSVRPILNGNLIADSMRVKFPSYYLDTINYFKAQDSTKRIAAFPLTDFWGWQFNDWNYRGSGFIWYGIPQPILDRTFDVWSPYNEGFYTEISHAVETGNADELKYVLNKYQVSYILFDDSIIEPGNPDSISVLQKERGLLTSSGYISKAAEFGKITIYQIGLTEASALGAPNADYSSTYAAPGQSETNPVVTETFPVTQGYQDSKNCDLKNQGSVVKEKRGKGNYYAAYDGGTSCDYFYYSTLNSSQGYVMRIQGKNISGRSLKFYLYNVDKKNVDREELLPVGDFDKSFTILPTESSSSASFGYTLNVETRSFGSVKSENLITGIEFYNAASQEVGGPLPVVNNLVIESIQKYGTWGYKIDLQSRGTYGPADVQGSGLMQLDQSFENGWVTSPFLEHVKVNSWANGWIVPAGLSTIYIFYWPQLLEWGGMILGIMALLVVCFP